MDYYLLKEDGNQAGPYSLDQLRAFWTNGNVTLNTPYWTQGLAAWAPLRHIEPILRQIALEPQIAVPRIFGDNVKTSQNLLRCNVCNIGNLEKRRRYRMSTPVVIIGYILLIPSILGILFGGLCFFGAAASSTATLAAAHTEMRAKLAAAQVPPSLIDKVIDTTPIEDNELDSLTPDQKSAVADAQSTAAAAALGGGIFAVFAGGVSIFIMISSFVGGLLGWLLVMKKRVLQCTHCEAAVAAS